ncbi:MAG: hypothetical protein H6828_03090 [Planctomycetes bacterium]|nr:hypothetical protein [Planctomycetota bacterium]
MPKNRIPIETVALGLLLAAAPAWGAQVEGPRPAPAATPERPTPAAEARSASLSLDDVRGANVVLREDAATSVGALHDFVLDRETGALTRAELLVGGSGRVVPVQRLTWDAAAGRWVLAMTRAELERAPIFDLALLEAESPHGKPVPADTSAELPTTRRLVLASELAALRLRAKDLPVGTTNEVVLHAATPAVAFLRVTPERVQEDAPGTRLPTSLVIPWGACELRDATVPPSASAPALRVELKLRVERSEVLRAPAPSDAEGHRVRDAAYRAALYEHFGLEAPAYDERATATLPS